MKNSSKRWSDVLVGVVTGATMAFVSLGAGANNILTREPQAFGLVILAGLITEGVKLRVAGPKGLDRRSVGRLVLVVAFITLFSFMIVSMLTRIVRYELR